MIDEIERLRKENSILFEIWNALPPTLMEQNERLEKEADWLACRCADSYEAICLRVHKERPYDSYFAWREAARNAVEKNNASK